MAEVRRPENEQKFTENIITKKTHRWVIVREWDDMDYRGMQHYYDDIERCMKSFKLGDRVLLPEYYIIRLKTIRKTTRKTFSEEKATEARIKQGMVDGSPIVRNADGTAKQSPRFIVEEA